jgi:anti-sigma regulatory factor (Ser/Thr protein kinase)
MTFADRVYAALVQDVPLEDDVALLAIESVPLGPHLELTLRATPAVLVGLRRTLGRWLIRHGVAPEVRFDITVAVSEAAGNAIEHAYGPGEALFTVVGEYTPQEVRLKVGDSGEWRRSTRSGRGRGLEIMRQLMDSADVEQSQDGTTVTLVKRLGEAS